MEGKGRAFEEFCRALREGQLPAASLSVPLQALWYEARGDWRRAHEMVQDEPGWEAAWVHAYLHRKEGDLSNARYWYRRAGQPEQQGSLQEEWEKIARFLLEAGGG